MQITTHFIFPPIPIRSYDWRAYYDAEGINGYGETEQDAIEDLKQQTEF
jgi:hypothetical protein